MNSLQETELGQDLHQLVSDQPFAPDIEMIGQRARQRRRRGLALRGATAAGAAILAAGGLVTAFHGTGSTTPGVAAGRPPAASRGPAANPRLVTLAAYVQASSGSLPGDASLVATTKTIGGRQVETDYFLYSDSGDIYSAASETGLPAAVAHRASIADGTEAREVAAARYAATGDLATARERMVNITGRNLGLGLSPAERQKIWARSIAASRKIFREKGVKPPAGPPAGKALAELAGNRIWISSMDALTAGGGNPQVRAGVLRLLATVPEVTVANSTTGGRPALTLTAGPSLFEGGSPEVLRIDARTGSPITFSSAADGNVPSSVQTYRVSRVTLAGIEAGKF
ncbi:MAG TPA: hypothetical protein VGG35_19920 [Streptosporangiaceae bacterium]|jgi:hypothetical protein